MAAQSARRFYVYLIQDGDIPAYVGKGSKSRLVVQKRKFGLQGRVLEYFACEKAAYKAERKWIKLLKPYFNKHPGGNGSRAKKEVKPRKLAWERAIEQIGCRAYAARILLAVYKSAPQLIDASKLDVFRSAANGAR